ncbi:slit homolog 1 protein [Bacillus rossius redtenbacheri]|uniref:slit homolog 1 protein n=1 Tax=Bacillus rossius redtenbacheri TaxID=93214 RepID=UPI002FDCB1EC
MLLPLAWCLAAVLAWTNRALAICPTSCKCDDDTLVVTCVQANLDVIPITLNPSIQRLVLRGNRVRTVDSAFQFYSELQYVDLSDNQLVSVPARSFDAQRKLTELHLHHNKISFVSNRTFSGLRALTVLSLRRNFLEEFPDQLFASLSRLEELDLGQNRISRVDARAFAGLASLKILYLDDNQLKVVPTPAFALLGGLAELHLGLNGFARLPDDAFAGLAKLAVLDLSGAGLVNVSEHAFRGLPALRYLGLADNRLSAVPTRQLQGLARLEELYLGQNDLEALPAGAFRGLANLRKLDVSGAPLLTTVERGALQDNLNLETLVLSSNKRLAAVEEGALEGLPNLRHLVLRDNAFASFPETLAAWPELRRIDLAENPLECRCGLLWLRDLLARRNATQVLCAAPQHLKDRSLPALTDDELGCALHDTRQQAIIGALCGCAVAVLAALGFLAHRHRRRFQAAVKDYKWNNRAISRKEHEYQKTFSDEEYISRAAQPQPLKPVPVTEL